MPGDASGRPPRPRHSPDSFGARKPRRRRRPPHLAMATGRTPQSPPPLRTPTRAMAVGPPGHRPRRSTQHPCRSRRPRHRPLRRPPRGPGCGHHRAHGRPTHDVSAGQRISTAAPARNARHPPRSHRTPNWPLPRILSSLGPPARLPLPRPLAPPRPSPHPPPPLLEPGRPGHRRPLDAATTLKHRTPLSGTRRRGSLYDNNASRQTADIATSAKSHPCARPHRFERTLLAPRRQPRLPLRGTFRLDTRHLSHQREHAVQRITAVRPDPPPSKYAHAAPPRHTRSAPQTAAQSTPAKAPTQSQAHPAITQGDRLPEAVGTVPLSGGSTIWL